MYMYMYVYVWGEFIVHTSEHNVPYTCNKLMLQRQLQYMQQVKYPLTVFSTAKKLPVQ